MATHSCIPAWEIPRTEEPGGPQSMGSQRVRLSDQNDANNLGLPVKITHTLHTIPKFHSQSYNLSKLVYSFWGGVQMETWRISIICNRKKKKKTGNETNIHHNKIRCTISLQWSNILLKMMEKNQYGWI